MATEAQRQTALKTATQALADALAQTISASLQSMADRDDAIVGIGAQVSALHEALTSQPNDNDADPIIGLEKVRRVHLDDMSKTAFYGGGGRRGFVHLLDVIELGPRRRGVRLSNLNAVLNARVRPAA